MITIDKVAIKALRKATLQKMAAENRTQDKAAVGQMMNAIERALRVNIERDIHQDSLFDIKEYLKEVKNSIIEPI